jgi:uncharacterized protein (DUF2235 family)
MVKKTILFFADGTWNDSNPNDGDDSITNVYKLFRDLAFTNKVGADEADLQLKEIVDSDGNVTQTAYYIWGIGAEEKPLKIGIFNTGINFDQLYDGATGNGFTERLLKGYVYISSVYKPGDDIITIGFSRGAYEARALAELICYMGLVENKENLAGACNDVWEYYSDQMFMKHKLPKPENCRHELVEASVKAVCVFDTVGSVGVGAFKYLYASEDIHSKIGQAFHAVAIDEQRQPFIPTLWKTAGNVTQLLFPGAHSDVGGGYKEGLHSMTSEAPYKWMRDALTSVRVEFKRSSPRLLSVAAPFSVTHRPWTSLEYRFTAGPRVFNKRKYNCDNHESVNIRIGQPAYCEDSDNQNDKKKWAAPAKYYPTGKIVK